MDMIVGSADTGPALASRAILRLAPGLVVGLLGDSITASANGGWQQELLNYCLMSYGDTGPVFHNHGVGGVSIQGIINDTSGMLTDTIADNPDAVMIEAGVNSMAEIIQMDQGGDHGPANWAAHIKAQCVSLIGTLRTALPNVMISWSGVAFTGVEGWPSPTNQNYANAINEGIRQACAQLSCQYINVTSMFLTQDQLFNTNNTSPGTPYNLSVDGLHPSWLGRPMYGTYVRSNIAVASPIYPDVTVDPAWRPDADVTPTVWIEADTLSAGAVNTWGPYTAFGTAPTMVANGWVRDLPCVRFNGTTDVMSAAGLSIAAGAKTVFAVYKLNSSPSTFNTEYSLFTLTNGAVTTEMIPWFVWLDGIGKVSISCDAHSDGSQGNTTSQASIYFADATPSTSRVPLRVSATFNGGTSTDDSQYTYYWGGYPATSTQQSTLLAQPAATCLSALGARVPDGVTPEKYAPLDLAALLVYPAKLTTVQWARVDQYLRNKWGP